MSYRENRKIGPSGGGAGGTYLPFQALVARTKPKDPNVEPKAAIRIIYGEVNPSLSGWETYKTPKGMSLGQDSIYPYQIEVTEFSEGKNTIYLVINFDLKLLKPISQHYIQDFAESESNNAKDRIENDFVWLYLPIADITRTDESLSVDVQYFTGNVLFRVYYTSINGAAAVEYFQCQGRGPTLLPIPPEEDEE